MMHLLGALPWDGSASVGRASSSSPGKGLGVLLETTRAGHLHPPDSLVRRVTRLELKTANVFRTTIHLASRDSFSHGIQLQPRQSTTGLVHNRGNRSHIQFNIKLDDRNK